MPADPEQVEKLERFTQDVWRGRQQGMTRRAFLAHGLRLGLSLPAISAVLVGCGVDPQPLRLPTRQGPWTLEIGPAEAAEALTPQQ